MANSNTLEPQSGDAPEVLFDLSETPTPTEQFDLGPSSSPAMSNPEFVKDRAEKFAFGTGNDPKAVQAQLESGGEYWLRQATANQKALEQKTLRNKMMYDAASKLNRPLTEADLNDFDALSKAAPTVDPATVLEESYGSAFAHFLIGSAKDTTVHENVLNNLPEASLDAMDAIGQAVAKREVANETLKGLEQRHSDLANDVTVSNLLKGTGQVIAGALFPSVTNSARETLKGFGLVGDYAKMFLPAYATAKLGGLKADLGKSLKEQYQAFSLMSPSEFKKEFNETVDKLAQSSLPLALQYAAGYQHYSTTDEHLDTMFGYADWLALGGTMWAARGAIKRFRAPPADTLGGRGPRGAPEGPTPYDTLGVAPDASDEEIKAAFRKAAKESHPDVAPGNDERFRDVSNAWEILGDKDKRAKYDAGEMHQEWASNKAKAAPEKKPAPKDTSPDPVPEPTADDQIQYIKDYRQAAKDTVKAANQERAEDAMAQLGEIDAAATEIAHKRIVDQFKGLDPFNDSLPLRDKTVSLFYPHETAADPGNLTHGQVARLVAHGTDNASQLLGILTNNAAPVRLTDEQAVKAIDTAKQQLLDTYAHVNDAILDVDLGGPFVVYTPEQQAVNVHTVELRVGMAPGKPEAPKAAPIAPKQKPVPKTPPSTGDTFTDVVNLHTSTKGRTLVRDLYDTMKKEGSFTGNLAEFRQKISDLRKSNKISMTPHEGELPKQSPEIKKSVSVGQSKPPVKQQYETKPLINKDGELVGKRISPAKLKDMTDRLTKGRRNDVEKVFKQLTKGLKLNDEQKAEARKFLSDDFDIPDIVFQRISGNVGGNAGRSWVAIDRQKFRRFFKDTGTYHNAGSDFLFAPETANEAVLHAIWHEIAHTVIHKDDLLIPEYERLIDAYAYRKTFGEASGNGRVQPKATATETVGEEGNFASEFRRDIGYGNETHRNRIIDSEFIVRPRSKYKSPLRAHYVEPPKGYEPKTSKDKPKTTVNYPRAEPTNDEQLMEALTNLMNKVAQTDNHDLWTRLSKSLNAVEKRNFRNEQNLGIDTREFDTDLLGSPYAKREPRTASSRRLSEDEQIRYAQLEGTAYDYLNSLAKAGKVSVQIKVGTPKAGLFDRRDRAAFYATNVYGLSPNQYRVMQQGNGFYISIAKMMDETHDATRDLATKTGNNRSNDRLANALFGTMVNPDEYLGELSRLNRKGATYGPQELHRIVQSSAENLLDLDSREREQLRSIFIANRDFKYLDENNKVRRGRFNETFGALQREFFDRFNELPSERQIAAYFDYVRLYDLDLAMRDLALVRDVGRLGLEKVSIGFHVTETSPDGLPLPPKRKQSKAFAARVVDSLPVDADENYGVYVYDPHARSGQFYLRDDLTAQVKADISDKTTNHGYKILEVGNPLEKPLRNVAKTDENINFIVVKDYDKRKYDWSNIPRRPGGHVDYQDGHFIKQPSIRRTEASGVLRHIYEGDETLLNLTSEAQAKKLAPQIEIARKLLKEGRMEELERHLAKNTPFDSEKFQSFFAPRTDNQGNPIPPRFNIDDEFTHVLGGKNTFDMAHFKDRKLNYPNFVDAIRSKYNLFANNVDKKYLGSRDPDVPAVFEFSSEGKEPEMTLTAPRLVDPFEVINSSLANVIRSKYLNDVKMQAAENFIQEFAPVLKTPLSEMRRNPVWYLHNPDWDTTTDALQARLTGMHVRQAALNMIGTQSELGKALTWSNRMLTNEIYTRGGQVPVDKFTDYMRNAKNPVDLMRAVVFHTKLGLFNPIQLFKQGVQMANATAIEGPMVAGRAFPRAILARWLALTEDPQMIDGLIDTFTNSLKDLGGFDGDHFREAYLELKKTGLYNVGGEYANRDDFFDPKVFQSKAGWFLDKGTMFFKEGERFPRLLGWFMAYDKWRLANPTKLMNNLERLRVLDRADLLTNNMSRASNANIQTGSLASTTQFFSYKWRLAEQILGTRLTHGERASLLLTNMALWGIPVGAATVTIWDYYDDIRKDALEAGVPMDNAAVQLLHEGLISMAVSQITGKEYNIAKAYGPSGLNIVKEVFTGETSLMKFLAGASGSVLQDMVKTSHASYDFVMNFMDPKHDAPTTADFVEFAQNISTVSNAIRAYYMLNSGKYITKNETNVIDGLNGTDAFMLAIGGLTQTKVGDTFLMIKSEKERKSAQHAAENEAVKYIKRSMQARIDGDEHLQSANLRKAKAALMSAKVPPHEWGSVLKRAYDGNVPLFEKALADFVKNAPPDEHDARQEQAIKAMK